MVLCEYLLHASATCLSDVRRGLGDGSSFHTSLLFPQCALSVPPSNAAVISFLNENGNR